MESLILEHDLRVDDHFVGSLKFAVDVDRINLNTVNTLLILFFLHYTTSNTFV